MMMSASGANVVIRKVVSTKKRLPEACFRIAELTTSGQLAAHKNRTALDLYVLACEGKVAEACFKVAEAFRTGEGAHADSGKAQIYYRTACDLGDELGCQLASK